MIYEFEKYIAVQIKKKNKTLKIRKEEALQSMP